MTDSTERPETEQIAPDPFDPATLQLSQNFAATVGVKKVLTKVPCRKPNKQEFVRVRPGAEWRVDMAVFTDEIEREVYIVATDLVPELADEVKPICLRLAINKQGDSFLWPLKLPGPDGRGNRWHESAVAAANHAEKKWVRVTANMSAGMYDLFEASGDLAEPVWPEHTFRDLIELAFRDRYIDTYNHPILKSLRGEV